MKKISKSILLCLPALLLTACEPGEEPGSNKPVIPFNEVSLDAWNQAIEEKTQASSLFNNTNIAFDFAYEGEMEMSMYRGTISGNTKVEEFRSTSKDTYSQKYDADKKIYSHVATGITFDIEDGEEIVSHDTVDNTYYDDGNTTYYLRNVEKTYQKLIDTEDTAESFGKYDIANFFNTNVQDYIDMGYEEGSKYYIDGEIFTYVYQDAEYADNHVTVQFQISDNELNVSYDVYFYVENNNVFSGLTSKGINKVKKETVNLAVPSFNGYELEIEEGQYLPYSNEVSQEDYMTIRGIYQNFIVSKACTGTTLNDYICTYHYTDETYSYEKDGKVKIEEKNEFYHEDATLGIDKENVVFFMFVEKYDEAGSDPYNIEDSYLYFNNNSAYMFATSITNGIEDDPTYLVFEDTLEAFCNALKNTYISAGFSYASNYFLMDYQSADAANYHYYVDNNVTTIVYNGEKVTQKLQVIYGEKITLNFETEVEKETVESYEHYKKTFSLVQEYKDTSKDLPNTTGLTPTNGY